MSISEVLFHVGEILLLLLIVLLKWHIYQQILYHLRLTQRHQDEVIALTRATKEWARSSHVSQQTAARTMEQVAQVAQVAPTLATKVDQVPERTADAVVERIKSGDSGVMQS